jgi:flagellar biosynthesis protein FlhF
VPAVAAAPKPAATPSQAHAATTVVPAATAAAAPVPAKPDFGITLMQREMREMRRMLEHGMAGMTWHDKRLREPLKTQVLEQLSALDIEPDVASAIAAGTPTQTNLKDPGNVPLAMLIKHLSFIDDTTLTKGGITALVGPTGAGKTTSIAKLAARWCLMYGNRDIALVSTDAYRIGAREQLMTYARILDVPMHTANSGKQLGILMERLSDKKLVLIDTAGMGPRDKRLREQIAALKQGAADAKVILTLPAQAESQALEDIVRAFAHAKPESCIITKIDEASTLGGVLSTAIRHKLKIAYVCDGQKVPDDLHAAQQRRVWLARLAQHMKAGAPRRDAAYLAQHFAKVPAHA